jgi:hypothetical protein
MPLYRSLMFLFLLFDLSSLIFSFKYSLFLFLKCQLSFSLTVLKLSSFITFGSCNHCSLACFPRSTNFEHSSSNYSLWRFASRWLIYSLAEIFIFSLIASHALLVSPLSSKFSRAENLFLNVTWYYYLTSPSFNFLRLNLSISILFTGRLFTTTRSLICNYQTMVSITFSPCEISDIKYTWMPSPVYQNVIILVVRLSIRRDIGVFMNAAIREDGGFWQLSF